MAAKNLMGKMRKAENPYEVWCLRGEEHLSTAERSWEWRVLKHYQGPDAEARNPHARTMCAVKGPGTFGDWDYGDTYTRDYQRYAVMVVDDRPKAEVA
jgi:hypothetical protein